MRCSAVLFALLSAISVVPTARATTVLEFDNVNHLFMTGPYSESGFRFDVLSGGLNLFRVSGDSLSSNCGCGGVFGSLPHQLRISSAEAFDLREIDVSEVRGEWALIASNGAAFTFGMEDTIYSDILLDFTQMVGWKHLSYVDVYSPSGFSRGFSFRSMTVQIVPEPSSLIVGLLGSVGLLVVHTARRKHRSPGATVRLFTSV